MTPPPPPPGGGLKKLNGVGVSAVTTGLPKSAGSPPAGGNRSLARRKGEGPLAADAGIACGRVFASARAFFVFVSSACVRSPGERWPSNSAKPFAPP